jgi:hypothetical protein
VEKQTANRIVLDLEPFCHFGDGEDMFVEDHRHTVPITVPNIGTVSDTVQATSLALNTTERELPTDSEVTL